MSSKQVWGQKTPPISQTPISGGLYPVLQESKQTSSTYKLKGFLHYEVKLNDLSDNQLLFLFLCNINNENLHYPQGASNPGVDLYTVCILVTQILNESLDFGLPQSVQLDRGHEQGIQTLSREERHNIRYIHHHCDTEEIILTLMNFLIYIAYVVR